MSSRRIPTPQPQPSFEDLLFPRDEGVVVPSDIADLMCCLYRVQLVRDGTLRFHGRTVITTPDDAVAVLVEYFSGVDREHFVVLMLDTRNAVIGLHTVAIGTLDASLVHPREVFKPAILASAAGVIVSHNHPSGNPDPSSDDRAVTQRLVESGALLGIPVLDHIIIGWPRAFASFKQQGLM